MNSQHVREALLQALTEIQQLSGRPIPAFSEDLCPIEDIEGFDSQNAEEAVVMMEKKFDCEIDTNPFVSDDGKRRLRIGEIVEGLCQLLNAQPKKI